MAKKSVKKNIPSKKIQKGLENFEINLRDFRINQNEMLNRENKINYSSQYLTTLSHKKLTLILSLKNINSF